MVAEGLTREQGRKTGQRITESGFNKAWRKARVAAGCPGRIPHDFRRTAVRTLVRAGVPERVAMQLTGHKTRAVFERYNIVSPGDLRDAATPREIDKLILHQAGVLAQKRLARGLRLNYVEAVASSPPSFSS